MERRIFVSVNSDRTLDDRRRQIKEELLARIVAEGFEPQVFFERGLARAIPWSFENVLDVLRRCQGALILGFPRWRVTPEGGQSLKMVGEYSHFEGAVALANGIPTLIAAEAGVMDRGIVYQGGGRIIAPIADDATKETLFADEFGNYFEDWLTEINKRPDIFLGYCSEASGPAAEIQLRLEKDGAKVHNWSMDFQSGASILEEIQNAMAVCSRGVFVFSEDDPLESPSEMAAPRDNVVFEAGAFIGVKGPKNCLIVRVGDAKMPADLGGAIYVALGANGKVADIEGQLTDFVKRSVL
ncbi:TIR domain-containing protein [Hoeflea sp.]|uniref:TIR domain-containing protein n=1 Tax=Hoeflea sp. TaxID=1940281 RepID=UPI003B027811